jgi:hypothetical protein
LGEPPIATGKGEGRPGEVNSVSVGPFEVDGPWGWELEAECDESANGVEIEAFELPLQEGADFIGFDLSRHDVFLCGSKTLPDSVEFVPQARVGDEAFLFDAETRDEGFVHFVAEGEFGAGPDR